MPELPEVQTIVDELSIILPGQTIVSCRIFRNSVVRGSPEKFRRRVSKQQIQAVGRRGKYILINLFSGMTLTAHLRMTGKFVLQKKNQVTRPHDRVAFMLQDNLKLIFSDVRCFGRLELVASLQQHPGIQRLGIEPWDEKMTPEYLQQQFKRRSIPVKTALMDQRIIAGLGNIYASEILFNAGINPAISAGKLPQESLLRIIRSMQTVLQQALKYNGTSISDYRRIDEKQGMFQNFLKVYGKAGKKCIKCSSRIEKILQNQRSTFFCPHCQT